LFVLSFGIFELFALLVVEFDVVVVVVELDVVVLVAEDVGTELFVFILPVSFVLTSIKPCPNIFFPFHLEGTAASG
jgi:hypothetical protein